MSITSNPTLSLTDQCGISESAQSPIGTVDISRGCEPTDTTQKQSRVPNRGDRNLQQNLSLQRGFFCYTALCLKNCSDCVGLHCKYTIYISNYKNLQKFTFPTLSKCGISPDAGTNRTSSSVSPTARLLLFRDYKTAILRDYKALKGNLLFQ